MRYSTSENDLMSNPSRKTENATSEGSSSRLGEVVIQTGLVARYLLGVPLLCDPEVVTTPRGAARAAVGIASVRVIRAADGRGVEQKRASR